MDPTEQFEIVESVESADLEVVGFYPLTPDRANSAE